MFILCLLKQLILPDRANSQKGIQKMVFTFRSMLFAGFVIGFLVLPVISACAVAQKDIHQQARRKTSDDDIILSTFEQTHAAIITQVRQGALPEDVEAKANELKIELKKYLIKTNADLQTLEVDVLHASAAERKIALKKLMDLAAEREHVKVLYMQRLKRLLPKNDEGAATAPLPVVPQSIESKTKDTGDEKSGTKWRTKDLDIEIEIAPEDISKGEHD
jgi:hypothetical protein